MKKTIQKLNQKGQLTLEFMLAVILIVSVSTLLGIMTFALTLTEVLQYVTFSAARTYFAADMSPDLQKQAGDAKADNLMATLPFLGSARQNQWITVKSQLKSGDYSSYGTSIGASAEHSQFVGGFQVAVTMPFMSVQIPFIKDVVQPPDGQTDFSTTISSFLTREPSFQECQGYLSAAWQALLTNGGYSNAALTGAPTVIIDNGC